ncbi:MAG: hypothetical protein RL095_981 [Verrucomicrobiota bacterium]|jgi:superfamily II DNA or RNA helicase
MSLLAKFSPLPEAAAAALLELSGDASSAQAVFGDDAETRLQVDGRRLRGSCSCGLWPCAHASALLALCDRRELLAKALPKNIAAKLEGEAGKAPAAELVPDREFKIQDSKFKAADPILKIQDSRFAASPMRQPQNPPPAASPPPADIDLLLVLARPGEAELWWRSRGESPKAGKAFLELPLPEHLAGLEKLSSDDRHLFRIDASAAPLLHRCLAAGRLFQRDPAGVAKLKKLRGSSFQLEEGTQAGSSSHVFTPRVESDAEGALLLRLPQELEAFGPMKRLAPGLLLAAGGVVPVEEQGAAALLEELLRSPLRVAPWRAREFLKTFVYGSRLDTSSWPAPFKLEKVSEGPTPCLYFTPAKFRWRGAEQLQAELKWLYGDELLPDDGDEAERPHFEAGKIRLRQPQFEKERRERLPGLGLRLSAGKGEEPGWKLAPPELPAVVRLLLDEGWKVFAEGKAFRQPREFLASFSTESRDWLDLQAGFDYGGQIVPLPQVLRAWKEGKSFLVLDDGSTGLLPEDWLREHTALTDLGAISTEGLRFSRAQQLLVERLLKSMPNPPKTPLRQAMEAVQAIPAVSPPAGLQAELRPYQLAGLRWLLTLARLRLGAVLADDMGLGKTLQSLAAMLALREAGEQRPFLLVAPKSLIFNWAAEAAKFTPQLKVIEFTGAGRSRLSSELKGPVLILTTYGTLRSEIGRFADIDFALAAADEAQVARNRESQTAKCLRLLKADFRLALTGTPVENSLADLFALCEFTNPGLLGSWHDFAAAYLSRDPGIAALASLRESLAPLILRRLKREVATELPPKTEQVLWCEASEDQQRLTQEIGDHYRSLLAAEDKPERPEILAALTRLRQAACHPGLLSPELKSAPSGKFEVLFLRLEELAAEGHKALVFSQFTTLLDLVQTQCDERGWKTARLDGQTRDRQAAVKAFQEDPECPLFLISLKAGGTGLNLTAASFVFLLDPWWNPAAESQAVDRAWRIGQKLHVTAYRLATRGTVEEKILSLQDSKRRTANAVAADAAAAELDPKLLLQLALG